MPPGAVANVKPPGPSYWLTMAHKLAGGDPGMFPSRRLIPQIHPIGVADRRLCGLEIEKKIGIDDSLWHPNDALENVAETSRFD